MVLLIPGLCYSDFSCCGDKAHSRYPTKQRFSHFLYKNPPTRQCFLPFNVLSSGTQVHICKKFIYCIWSDVFGPQDKFKPIQVSVRTKTNSNIYVKGYYRTADSTIIGWTFRYLPLLATNILAYVCLCAESRKIHKIHLLLFSPDGFAHFRHNTKMRRLLHVHEHVLMYFLEHIYSWTLDLLILGVSWKRIGQQIKISKRLSRLKRPLK